MRDFSTTLSAMTYELERVCARRDNQIVLRGIDLRLPRGRLLGIVGPNGAGKSSLLSALAGDIEIEQGRVSIDEADIARRLPGDLALMRAVMTQQPGAAFNLTVKQVLELGLYAFSHWSTERQEALLLALAQSVGIDEWLSQSLTSRSWGQQQRVHFARALLQAQATWHETGKAWLLLDEPTASQDPWHQQAMLAACRAFLSWGHVGVVVVLHDLTLAAQWCDDLVILKDGCVLVQGPCDSVLTPSWLGQAFGDDLKVDVRREPLPGVIMSR